MAGTGRVRLIRVIVEHELEKQTPSNRMTSARVSPVGIAFEVSVGFLGSPALNAGFLKAGAFLLLWRHAASCASRTKEDNVLMLCRKVPLSCRCFQDRPLGFPSSGPMEGEVMLLGLQGCWEVVYPTLSG